MRTYSEVTPKRAPGYSHVLPAAMHVTTCMGQWWHRPHLFLNATNEPQKQSHLCRPRPQQGQQLWEQHLHQNQPQPDGRVTFQNHRMVSFQTSGHSDSVTKNLLSLSSHGGQRHWWQWQREATCQDPAVNVHTWDQLRASLPGNGMGFVTSFYSQELCYYPGGQRMCLHWWCGVTPRLHTWEPRQWGDTRSPWHETSRHELSQPDQLKKEKKKSLCTSQNYFPGNSLAWTKPLVMRVVSEGGGQH